MEEKNFHVLPGWETVRVIGNGSSGLVYEIRKIDEYGGDLHSALKIVSIPATKAEYEQMKRTMSEDELRRKMQTKAEEITSEYRLMGVLKGHPNIVSCEDQMIVPHEDDFGMDIYIRMELLSSLPDYVHQNGITGTEVMKLCMDICSALEACRVHGIIHRDIKPQNIFVSPYGAFKLGDFGVAKASSICNFEKVGTYSYMAPEVFKGKQYDSSVDIYSLGMVLYWLLNERRGPFLPMPPATPTKEQIADAQLCRNRGDALPEPKYGNAEMKKLVLKACAFNPEDRFRNPTEMKKAVAMAVKGNIVKKPAVAENDPTIVEKPPVKKPETYTATKPKPQMPPVQKPAEKPKPEVKSPTQPKTQPKPQPKAKQEEEKKHKGSVVYIVILSLIILAMLGGIIFFLTSDGSFPDFSFLHHDPAPTPTPEPTQKIVSVILSSPTLSVKEAMTEKLDVSFIPEPEENVKLVWKSSNSGIAEVDNNGNVTGVSEGTATIRVYLENDAEVYDECVVTVEKPKIERLIIESEPERTRYSLGDELDTTGLVLRVYFDNDTVQRITDPAEYTVTGDLNGLGTRTITVMYEDATVEFTVWVGLF